MTEMVEEHAGVTRTELAHVVRPVLEGGAATRGELVAAARAGGARERVIDALRSLPDVTVRSPRELWAHLPDLPVR